MATAFDLRLANERRGDTPNYVKVTSRHVMFTADEKCQPLRNLLYDREHDFDVILGSVVPCRKLKWICREHSNDDV